MDILLSILSVLLAVTCVFLLSMLLRRNKEVDGLKKELDQVESVASSSKHSMESLQRKHEADREKLNENETKISEFEKSAKEALEKLETCNQANAEKDKQIQEMSAKIEAFEPTQKRAHEAEDKLLVIQKESVALRNECAQAHKRVEAAESAGRDKQIKFERIEATLEAKDKALTLKQQESADLAHELNERRSEISELVIERDKLISMEAALKEKLEEAEGSLKSSERDRQKLNDEFTECRLELAETREKLNRIKQMFDEQAAAGENDIERLQKLRDQLLEVEGKLSRKESALSELEAVHADSSRETPYEAHKHMEWTLNHFDPKAITFKFSNSGAKVFLVDVQTSAPQLRHIFETGRELPRDDDFESRIKIAIKKSEQQNMEELPEEFDMTVFYALNIYPIQFKIRPREGQKIERIKEG